MDFTLNIQLQTGTVVRRNLMNIRPVYNHVELGSSNFQSSSSELAPQTQLTGSPASILLVGSDSPVTLILLRADGATELEIKNTFFTDDPVQGFLVQNKGIDVANITLTYITQMTELDTAFVKTVNGEVPDGNGNVELDVGVKTIDGAAPDANGNINIDTNEGTAP